MPGWAQFFCIKQNACRSLGSRADRGSLLKFPRGVAEKREREKRGAREYRGLNSGLSDQEACTHLTMVRCAGGNASHGAEVHVKLLKCVVVGGLLVSANQAF